MEGESEETKGGKRRKGNGTSREEYERKGKGLAITKAGEE